MEMKYLTEKDMEYFKKRAKNGQAVILKIDAQKLLQLDLRELDHPEDKKISEAELLHWLCSHEVLIMEEHQKLEEIRKENGRILNSFSENTKVKEQEAKRETGTEVLETMEGLLDQAARDGLSVNVQKLFQRTDLTVDQLKKLYQVVKELG